MVFNHSIGVKHIGANLASPCYVFLCRMEFFEFLLLLFFFKLVESCAKHLHCNSAVLVLRSLILAANDYSSWQMGNSHSGVGFVYVLTTLATRAKRINP